MGGPTQRRREEQRPAEVQVPQLSREEVEQRAGRAYDAAVTAVMRTHFRPPPAAELSAFRRGVEARVRAGEDVDVGQALSEYCAANPNSMMARYNRIFNGSTEWLLDEEAGRVGFRAAVFERLCRNYLSVPRQEVVSAFVRLADPNNRNVPIGVSALDGDIVAALTAQIGSQVRAGPNQLAATIRFERPEARMLVATLLPPPQQQEINFGKKKA